MARVSLELVACYRKNIARLSRVGRVMYGNDSGTVGYMPERRRISPFTAAHT